MQKLETSPSIGIPFTHILKAAGTGGFGMPPALLVERFGATGRCCGTAATSRSASNTNGPVFSRIDEAKCGIDECTHAVGHGHSRRGLRGEFALCAMRGAACECGTACRLRRLARGR